MKPTFSWSRNEAGTIIGTSRVGLGPPEGRAQMLTPLLLLLITSNTIILPASNICAKISFQGETINNHQINVQRAANISKLKCLQPNLGECIILFKIHECETFLTHAT